MTHLCHSDCDLFLLRFRSNNIDDDSDIKSIGGGRNFGCLGEVEGGWNVTDPYILIYLVFIN